MKATRFQTTLFHRLTTDERNWQPSVLPCATKSGTVCLCHPLLTTLVSITAEQYMARVRAAQACRGMVDDLGDGLDLDALSAE